jgi:predicted dithiol-disulfide oxidoreductase (DUF899 family)
MIARHKVVSHQDWQEARQVLLAREKEFTRLRDELSEMRRDLPWEPVTKEYVFDGPQGRESLRITHARHQRRCGRRPDRLDLHQPTCWLA